MPKLKCLKVVSCSSEHPNHPASNLLLEPGKGIKWITNHPGEDTAEVLLQLEVPCKIININIGNAHSANIGVLVGNSMRTNEEFQTILPIVTFMTPIESRNSEKTEQVKTFLTTDLDSEISKKDDWNLIKVVCTQPFNKQVNYGLTFISVFGQKSTRHEISEDKPVPQSLSQTSPRMLGRFKIREDSPEDDSPSAGLGMFNKWKNDLKHGSTSKMITPPPKIKPTNSTKVNETKKVPDRNRKSLIYDSSSEEEKNERVKHSAKKLKVQEQEKESLKRKKLEEEESEKKKKRIKTFNEFINKVDPPPTPEVKKTSSRKDKVLDKPKASAQASSPQRDLKPKISQSPSTSSKSQDKSPPKTSQNQNKSPRVSRKKSPIRRPFNQFFTGVTLVISGIQNPERAELRKQALEMGARYNADWNNSCTHLICAFKNTPKYREVRGKGKIVTQDWISKSYSKRIRLPWRRFALDDREQDKDESEEEIREEKKSSTTEDKDDVLALYDLDYDASPKKTNTKSKKNNQDDDVYEHSTEDDDASKDSTTQSHPQSSQCRKLFEEKTFFLHTNLADNVSKKFEKSIPIHGGKIIPTLHDADYVISSKRLKCADFGISGDVLDPKWVNECIAMENMVPMSSFSMEF